MPWLSPDVLGTITVVLVPSSAFNPICGLCTRNVPPLMLPSVRTA